MVTRLTHALGAKHLSVAEDAVQDALLRALQAWPVGGVPAQPAAWLFTVARHRALDRLRRDTWFREREGIITAAVLALGEQGLDEGRLPFGDADLCVMFLTCHPALSRDARVALTLKTVCGFGVDEIARAYLQPATTVAQRLVRAKRTLRDTDAVAELPARDDLVQRRAAVLEALYLMFNEGYAAHDGEHLTRPDVCEEAVRLTRLLAIAPDTACPAASALLALMLLHSARLAARTSNEGDVLLLDAQDRSQWDRGATRRGARLVRAQRGRRRPLAVPRAGRDRRHACDGSRHGPHRLGAHRLPLRPVASAGAVTGRAAESRGRHCAVAGRRRRPRGTRHRPLALAPRRLLPGTCGPRHLAPAGGPSGRRDPGIRARAAVWMLRARTPARRATTHCGAAGVTRGRWRRSGRGERRESPGRCRRPGRRSARRAR